MEPLSLHLKAMHETEENKITIKNDTQSWNNHARKRAEKNHTQKYSHLMWLKYLKE